jgi:hypothetical protein
MAKKKGEKSVYQGTGSSDGRSGHRQVGKRAARAMGQWRSSLWRASDEPFPCINDREGKEESSPKSRERRHAATRAVQTSPPSISREGHAYGRSGQQHANYSSGGNGRH